MPHTNQTCTWLDPHSPPRVLTYLPYFRYVWDRAHSSHDDAMSICSEASSRVFHNLCLHLLKIDSLILPQSSRSTHSSRSGYSTRSEGKEEGKEEGKDEGKDCDEDEEIHIANQLPVWDRRAECFTMKFENNRIRASSSKNIILFPAYELFENDRPPETPNMQFGKITNGNYALDFRVPVAPVQAFAIALSTFLVKEPETKKKSMIPFLSSH